MYKDVEGNEPAGPGDPVARLDISPPDVPQDFVGTCRCTRPLVARGGAFSRRCLRCGRPDTPGIG